MIKLSEVQAKLDAATEKLAATKLQVDKVVVEVQALKDSFGDAPLPPEAEAAFGRLEAALEEVKTGVQKVDDINPDGPTPPAG